MLPGLWVRASSALCCNVLEIHAAQEHINHGAAWESGASRLTLSIPINRNLPFKCTGREIPVPQPFLSTFHQSAEAPVLTPVTSLGEDESDLHFTSK